MPNTLASLMLFLWPVVVVVLFRTMPMPRALAISIVGGYLILPSEPAFNLPLLPTYGKELAASLPALVMALVMSRPAPPGLRDAVPAVSARPGWLPRSLPVLICFVAILAGAVPTVLMNSDPLSFPLRTLPGLRPYDAGSAILGALTLLLPFVLARKFLARPEDHAMLLVVLAAAALAYSLPTLWEVRMSPRLNSQIYGFFPHDWRQHLRAGGYRPVVFLEHGLRLGLFLGIGVLAAVVAARFMRPSLKGLAVFGALWLFATLVLSKNLTAFLAVCLLLPAALALRPRSQMLVAAVFAGAVLFYPMARAAGLVPLGAIAEAISTFAESGRLASLNYRVANEDMLLEKARERPLFGWGGWGRARVYDERGRDISTTDGTWIIEFGEKGWMGYLARFGLLTLPILILALRPGGAAVTLGTSGLAVALAANLLDLIPNSGLTPLTWLMAGALAGRLEATATEAPEAEAEAADAGAPGRRALPYRRPLAGAAAPPRPEQPAADGRSPVTGVAPGRRRRRGAAP